MKPLLAFVASLLWMQTMAQEDFGDLQQFTPRFDDPKKLHVSDLDANGYGDIVFYGRAFGGAEWATQWLRQTAPLTFTVQELPFTNYTHELMVDIDEDGDTDQVYFLSGEYLYRPNDGAGNFGDPILLENLGGSWVDRGDLNADGNQDILVSYSDYEWSCDPTGTYGLLVHYGDGAGNFAEATEVYAGSFDGEIRTISEASIGDLDANGYPDIVFTINHTEIEADCGSSSDNDVYRLEQSAEGFSEPILLLELSYQQALSLEVVDMDGDGDLDIVYGYSAHFLANDGTGNFPDDPVDMGPAESSHLDYPVQLADIDGDGLLESLLTLNSIELVTHSSPGDFGGGTSITNSYPTHNNGYTIQGAFGHINQDAYTDAVTIEEHGDAVRVHPGKDNGTTDSWVDLSSIGFSSGLGVLDLNGDDAPDFIDFMDDENLMLITLSAGNTALLPLPTGMELPMDALAYFYRIGDIDGNGWDDVVVSGYESSTIWYSNDGSGTLTYAGEITGDGGRELQLADLTGDGTLDVVVWKDPSTGFENPIVVYSNVSGSGTFEEVFSVLTMTATGGARTLQVGDMDGDGDLDLIGANQFGQAYYLDNDGTGSFDFVESALMEGMDDFESLALADFNQDGFLDVAYTGRVDGTSSTIENLYVEFNDGAGDFGNRVEIENSYQDTRKVVAADLDSDGDMDLVFMLHTGTSGADCNWSENIGLGLFAEITEIAVTGGYKLADMDADGVQDVIVTGNPGGWLRNLLAHGCTDETACNYDPDALFSDGSCCFTSCGCTDNTATNYDNTATCDNGTCEYSVSGFVYHDVAADGNFDPETDTPLAFTQVLVSTGEILFTDDNGAFVADVEPGGVTFTVEPTEAFPFSLHSPQAVVIPSDAGSNLEFGLSANEPVFGICVDLYPSAGGFLCNDMLNYNICFRNMSNVPISGVVEVEYDELFQWHQEVTPIDSVNGNTVYMSFEDLPPGVMYFYDLGLQSPTVDFIGEDIWAEARVTGYNSEGVQAAYGAETRIQEVTCAYDPNDKQAFPEGYSEDHLLLAETEQEFLVRFQNTGNAPAQDVVIVDTLDVNFDLETFQIMANSHSMSAVIDTDSREIRFQFYDIQLPDSTCCEPESHGLVSYTVRSLPGLDHGTVLENTAYIFFDNNDPIVTNTTWTTIHACQEELGCTSTHQPECPGQVAVLESSYNADIDWDQEFAWKLDGETLSNALTFDAFVTANTDELLTFEATNPLCFETGSVQVVADPEAFTFTCLGDLNCDGTIGATDINVLLGNYACNQPLVCRADLNNDQVVDASDLMVVLGAWGTWCE